MPEFPDARNVLEPECSRCPALVESRERISWGNGALDADVMVVGEAPAFGDPDAERWRGGNWTGMAYTSRHSGRVVRDLFADAGLDAENLYFTNAVKCFPSERDDPDHGSPPFDSDPPPGNDPPSNREPTPEERANCRAHLRTEIEQIEPTVVATTGKHATLAVLDERELPGGFLDSVLNPRDALDFDATVLPLLHPSYQNVWLPRIGYDRTEYVAELGATIEQVRDSEQIR